MSILITGGAGYIGSHTVFELLKLKKEIIVVDNLSNSTLENLYNIENHLGVKIPFFNVDLCDINQVEEIFKNNDIESIIHFAGLKSVSESISDSLQYYTNNIGSTLCLLNCVEKFNVKNFIFSSSATVYEKINSTIKETDTLSPINPYGHSKLMIEQILKDFSNSNCDINIVILRYFNPVGADPLGIIGENDVNSTPNNLMPYVLKVVEGIFDHVNVYGKDYNTIDGTGVRDYIHVQDLAIGHVCALEKILKNTKGGVGGCDVYNLGTGTGYSVLEIINEMEKHLKRNIPYKFTERRCGDQAIVVANTEKANVELNWKSKKGLSDICRDVLNYCVKK
jgi:UDP-glucose 4-epimerase